ncbi:MAG TPA: S-layer homology domain-containing protein [Egicoccus sp.]|nr:S-layer homology domain-containing protein [Egicoccus sp.]HSK25170.1 S-layer homology domain-containing protein [Egicoccus sp.]
MSAHANSTAPRRVVALTLALVAGLLLGLLPLPAASAEAAGLSVTGDVRIGATLTVVDPDAAGSTYRWLADGVEAGTGPTLRVPAANVGATLEIEATRADASVVTATAGTVPDAPDLAAFVDLDPTLEALIDPSRTSYDVTVPSSLSTFTTTVPTMPAGASVTVDGVAVAGGQVVTTALPVGTTEVRIVVVDGVGGAGEYTIRATRPAPPPPSSGGGSRAPAPTPTEPVTPEPVRAPTGDLPAPGTGRATIGGTAVDLEVGPGTDDGGVAVAGPGFDLELAPTGTTAGAPAGQLVLGRGRPASITVAGFAPRTPVRLWLFSTPTLLGAFETGADGTLSATTADLGGDVEACRHTLHAEGELPGGDTVQLSLGVWVDAEPYPYGDVTPGSTHARSIACLADRDVIDGTGPGRFGPAATLTRGQAASLVSRLLGFDLDGAAGFRDAAASVHSGAIAAAVDAGLLHGYADGTFRPGRSITRAQVASLLAAAADLDTDRPSAFAETDGSVHAGAIAALVEAGITSGYGDGGFRPDLPVTRAQAASMLMAVQDRLAA